MELKPISRDAIPRALLKAERYRLLNEPREAESICLDILAVDSANQEALVTLVLAITDLFHGVQAKPDEARPFLERIADPYGRAYYSGMIDERWAKALLDAHYPPQAVHDLVHSAMRHYKQADELAAQGNDDAVLRWNTCVRMIERHQLAAPGAADALDEEAYNDTAV